MVFLCMFSRDDDCAGTFHLLHFFPQSGFEAPFTKTQRITLMGVRGGQTTTRKRANNRRSSVTPTPPPNLMAPDSEDEEEEEDDDTTTGKTTRRNTTSNFKIHRRNGGRHDGGSISTAVVLTLACAFVCVGVFLQARTVAKIVKGSGVRTTTTTEKLDPSIRKEVQKMKEKMDAQRKEMDEMKKVVNEEKPWEFAMQKTIDAWYEGSSGKNSKGSWFGVGKRKHASSSLPPWQAKDEEIEKATAQLRADLEDVKLKLAKRGVSTQTYMQRMTHMLADKTGLVDYASVHGGGRVLKHSTLSPLVARESGPITAMLMYFRGKAAPHPKSNEWLLKQTLEPPGDCLALRGTKGYVDVHLKEKITVSGFTLEHVNPLIAYDRSSAPKEVKLGAWGMFPKVTTRSSTSDDSNDNTNNDYVDVKKMSWRYEEFGNFTFDPTHADGVTTFTFSEDKIVGTTDRVRFSVDSNHGNTKWTCVYRLRVHGSKNK